MNPENIRVGTTTNSGVLKLADICARAYSGPGDLQTMVGPLIRVRPPDRLAD
jgi:hypothetical protein